MTAVVFWRPSDAISIRAISILENLQRAFPQFFSVVAILAPKYPSERIMGSTTENNGKDSNVLDSLLIPSEKPGNILLDANLEAWKDLTVKNWPSVFICVKKGVTGGKDGGKDGNDGDGKGKIVFALESQRAVSGMVGKALSAVLSVIQYEQETLDSLAESERTGEDVKINSKSIGMWGRNFDAIFTNTPLIPLIAVNKVKLNRPMRLTINNKNGLLYIADTGTYVRTLLILTWKKEKFYFNFNFNLNLSLNLIMLTTPIIVTIIVLIYCDSHPLRNTKT